MLIIHIDDDADDHTILVEAVRQIVPDVSWIHAMNGADGYKVLLNTLSETPVDCVFLDINMPGMTGLECLRAIRENAGLATIPVVVYTTTDDPAEKQCAWDLGALYLQKTYSFRMLVDQLGVVLKRVLKGKPHFGLREQRAEQVVANPLESKRGMLASPVIYHQISRYARMYLPPW